MINTIINFIKTNAIEIIKISGTVVVAYLTAKIAARNNKKQITTQFFKEKGIDTQEKILRFWCILFMNDFRINESYIKAFKDLEKKNDSQILLIVYENSYIYCSSKTIKALKEYQQCVYKNAAKNNKIINNSKNEKSIKFKIIFAQQFVLISRIIAKMKYDFTGEKVDELDLIKIKIRDLDFTTKIISRLMLWYYNIKSFFI